MKYIEKNIQKNEKIQKEAKISSIALVGQIILLNISFLLLRFVSELGKSYDSDYGVIMFFIILIVFILNILKTLKILFYILTSELVFTNKRVLSKKGILNIKTLDSPLDKINDFEINQSFLGRIFDYSDVVIKTSSSVYSFCYIKEAHQFKNMLTTTDKVQKVEVQNSNDTSKYDDLVKLKKLLDDDIITKTEFEEEKKKLLK